VRTTIKPLIQKALFLLLITLAGVSHAQIPQIERDALVALYNSTVGPFWTDNTGCLEGLELNVVGSGLPVLQALLLRLIFIVIPSAE
jgi:hypothetical protein